MSYEDQLRRQQQALDGIITLREIIIIELGYLPSLESLEDTQKIKEVYERLAIFCTEHSLRLEERVNKLYIASSKKKPKKNPDNLLDHRGSKNLNF